MYSLFFTLWSSDPHFEQKWTRQQEHAASPRLQMNLEPQHGHSHNFLNLMTFIGAIQTVCSLSLSLSHTFTQCVWERERNWVGGWVGAGLLMCDLKSRRWKERLCFWLELKAFNLSNKLNHKTAEPRHVLNWFIDIFFNFVAMHQAVLI